MEEKDRAYNALLLMNSRLMKANQQLVEALIANNATEYALAQHIIERTRAAQQSNPQDKSGSVEGAIKGIVDEAALAASDPGG